MQCKMSTPSEFTMREASTSQGLGAEDAGNSDVISGEAQKPQGQGRPRRDPLGQSKQTIALQDGAIMKQEEDNENGQGLGDEAISKETQGEGASFPLKRGRGRPPKVSTRDRPKKQPNLSQEERKMHQKQIPSVKKGRERPRTQLDISDNEETHQEQTPGVKRGPSQEEGGGMQPEQACSGKRGRRRPRIHHPDNLDEEERQTEETPGVKSGLGRPKKQSDQEHITSVKRGRGKPKKKVDDDSNWEDPQQEQLPGVKRGPGRRRKQPNISDDLETPQEHMPGVKGGPGRQKKQLDVSEEKREMDLEQDSSVKRGRGKPRIRYYISDNEDEETHTEQMTGMKKAQERPRKQPESYDDDGDDERTPCAKKKRGTPKQNHDNSEYDEIHQETTSSVKRGRGRPRKQTHTVKRGRGRAKKKLASSDDENIMEGEPPSVKRRREQYRRGEDQQPDNYDTEVCGTQTASGVPGRPARKRNRPRWMLDIEDEQDTDKDWGKQTTVKRRKAEPSPICEEDKIKFSKEVEVWQESLDQQGYAVCPLCMIRRRALKTIVDHYKICSQNLNPDGSFNCSKCEEKLQSANALKYHLSKMHHVVTGSAVSKKDEELTDKQRLRLYLKKHKRLHCTNTGCDSSFATIYGYQYHRERCGVDPNKAIKFVCPVCPDKVYLSRLGLTHHHRTYHEPKNEQKATDRAAAPRRAAQKAMDQVKALKDLQDDPSVDLASTRPYLYFKCFYKLTKVAPSPSDDQQAVWESYLKRTPPKKLTCQHCHLQGLSDVQAMISHHINCFKNPKGVKVYHCTLCTDQPFETQKLKQIKSHITRKHRKRLEAKMEARDFKPGSSGESSSDSNEYSEPDEAEGKYKNKPLNRAPRMTRPKFFNMNELEKVILEQQMERLCGSEGRLFQDLGNTTGSWPQLSEVEAAVYRHGSGTPTRNGTETHRPDATPIPLYGTVHEKSPSDGCLPHHAMNCGGPVLAMAWCPTPLDMPAREQYAAISSYPSQGHLQQAFKATPGPGLIQLWAFGTLQTDSAKPKLCALIGHNEGNVRAMTWCPSGCWEDSSQSEPRQESSQSEPRQESSQSEPRQESSQSEPRLESSQSKLSQKPGQSQSSQEAGQSELCKERRLGILAAATSNGTVLMYSISHPVMLDSKHVYKPIPNLILKPKRGQVSEKDCWFGPCLCLDWLPRKPHSKIAAGYSNGCVVIWNVGKECSLLRERNDDGSVVLYPCRVFPAHVCVVQSVQWSPSDGNFLCSVGRDKSVHFWDTRWPAVPLTSGTSAPVVSRTQWASLWNGTLSAYLSVPPRIYLQDASVTPSTTVTAWMNDVGMVDIRYSEWLNSIALSDIAGNVTVLALPMLLISRSKSRLKIQAHKVKVQERDKSDPHTSFQSHPEAVTKIEWNINRHVCRWLLFGDRNGLVRLCHIAIRQ